MFYSTVTDFALHQVAHFSKYGLQDSDEEEEVPLKADPKKLKISLPPSRLQQLPTSQQKVVSPPQVELPAHLHSSSLSLKHRS